MAKDNAPLPNTLVVDVDKGWELEYVENPAGKLRRFNGRPVYYMIRGQDGNLKPIVRTDTIDTPPEKLYRALHWPEVNELFKLNPNIMDRLQTGATIALVGLLLLFIIIMLGGKGII